MIEAEIAANWWTSAIVKPEMDTGSIILDTMMNSSMAKDNLQELSAEQLNMFRNTLYVNISESLQKYTTLTLDVDYNPCYLLKLAANEAGIGENQFPVKTDMLIEVGHVSVSHGYGAAVEVLYETVEYWKRELRFAEEYLTEWLSELGKDPESKIALRSIGRYRERIQFCGSKIDEFIG